MDKTLSFRSSFYLFFLFNLVFFGLQGLCLALESRSFIHELPLTKVLRFELLVLALIHLVLYALLSWAQSWILSKQVYWKNLDEDRAVLVLWSLTTCLILTANGYFFPQSRFSSLLPIPQSIIFFLFIISSIILGLMLLYAISRSMNKYIVPAMLLIFLWIIVPKSPPQNLVAATAPNIIIIGIDSLVPSKINEQSMPFLNQRLADSVQFTNTISPLARTHPAWVSILTGLYPKNHGAIENLVPKDLVKHKLSIAWSLKVKGYQTVFATDEKRFSNINQDFGFDIVIGPKFGANDLVIGSVNDFPLSNLLINLPFAQYLFPYNYINRASFFSYYPRSFDKILAERLARLPINKPKFIAVHFTLPHWPYTWAEIPKAPNYQAQYAQALNRVDKQLAFLVRQLEKQGILKNSLVIFLSDHGETLNTINSRPLTLKAYQGTTNQLDNYFKYYSDYELNKSMGHGSDLLSPDQFKTLLAFQYYQHGQLLSSPKKIASNVALIDLAPTLYQFIQLKPSYKMDGISLLASILNHLNDLPSREFFLESGMLANKKLNIQNALDFGKQFFRIDHQGELVLQRKKLDEIRKEKQYGLIRDDWLLALYPVEDRYITVLLQLSTGKWTDEPKGAFAQTTPLSEMLQSLIDFQPEIHVESKTN